MTDDTTDGEVSTTDERSVTASRVIEAPPERIYEAFFDPDELVAWVTPDGFSGTVQELDPEEGGTFRLAMDAETEEMEQYSHTFEGTYQELKRGEKIVWHDESGEGDDHGTATVTLETVPDGTKVTINIEGIPEHAPIDQAQANWERTLESLAALVTEGE